MKKFTLLFTSALALILLSRIAQAQVILSADFESGQPAGWTITTQASDGGWNFGANTDLQSTYFPIAAHTKMACSNDDGCDCDKSVDYFISPAMDLTSYSSVFLSFDSYFYGATFQYATEVGTIEASTDGGASWDVVNTLTGFGGWTTLYLDLSAYAGQSNVQIAFHYNDGGGWLFGWALDNVSIYSPAAADISLTSISPVEGATDSYVAGGTNVSLSGTIFNVGGSPITTFTAYYSDGVNTWSDTKTGLNVGSLQTYSFTHNTPYNVATGSHDLSMWVSLSGDNNHINDSAGTNLQGYLFAPVHTTTYEEATGTWCGWCVRGIIFMDSLAHVYPSTTIGIAVHNGDPMAVTTYDAGETSFPGFPGFPSILVDRKVVDDPMYVFDEYDLHSEDFGFAEITLQPSYNSTTKVATVIANAHFAVDLSGDYRLACVFTEDDVTGTGSTWAQHNYYSGGNYGSMGGFEDMPATIPAASMHYNFVARTIVGGYTGLAGSLPSTISAGETDSHTFTYTVPAADDVSQMKAIILLINNQTGQILNAAKEDLITTGISPVISAGGGVDVYPNPVSDVMNVIISLSISQNVSLELSDVSGRVLMQQDNGKLSKGDHQVQINSKNLPNGIYTLTMRTESGSVTTKVVKSE